MAKPIPQQVVESCPLTRWDPSEETFVKVKVANAGAYALRQDHFNRITFETDGAQVRQVQDWSVAELTIKECWLTFGGSNLEQATADGSSLLFDGDLTFTQFRAAFGQLPDELAEEWHEHVLRLNPKWQALR